VAADGGNRRDADEMPTPTLDEVLQSERRHRREPCDIHGDRVGLGAPLEVRIVTPRPGRDDEHISATELSNQVTRSRPGIGDIVQIEPNRREDPRVLSCDFTESFDATRCDPNGISTSRQLHCDGGAYSGGCTDDDCGTCQVFLSCLANDCIEPLAANQPIYTAGRYRESAPMLG